MADDAVVRQVVGQCQELTSAECADFLEHGFVLLRNAFDRKIAEEVVEQAWRSLEQDAGILRDDRESWKAMPYVRPAGSNRKIRLADEAPRALRAQTDLLGGAHRLKGGGDLSWGDGTVANLCKDGDKPYPEPRPEMDGWHFDGWDFYHYLDSPEQALLVVPLFSDIMPHSGGTLIATDSIGVVAKFLAAHPEGVHPDGTQGGGYLIPSLIEQCTQFVEITGNAGDLALLHPYMLHRAAANPSGVARFIQNGRLSLAEPLNFSRSNPADYSLVELAVLRALGTDRLRDWKPSGPRENNDMCTDWGRVPPRPFRSDAEREEQAAVIAMEQARLKQEGIHTPVWATDMYMHIDGKGAHPSDRNPSRRTVFLGDDKRVQQSERTAKL
jgi:hypothetical protein